MTVLVTGAAGLVGHAVRQRLEGAGTTVVPLDVVARSEDGVEQLACDLLDERRLDEVFATTRPDVVVHAGGVSGPMVRTDDPVGIVRVNVDGTANLLDAARRHGAGRVVYCSSIAAYGATAIAGRVGEETPLHPTQVYGATKAAGEQLLEAYRHQFGLSTAALRLVAVFGPRRRTDCLIRRLLVDARAGRTTRIEMPADAPQEYVYVDDAADAVVAAVGRPDAVGAYNVTGDGARTVEEIVAAVRAVEPGVRAEPDPPDPATAEWRGPLDPTAATRDLGWTARWVFDDAVRAYRDRLAARRDGG
ncbi:NAD-dependent epimerase/dehydratase family protein [Actinomycetospora termitidis]|uniref:NAD(P)-dependent oxidoreductase n=1 Tax=Actinomycetospora termitidis TaxID=3053470 RepID=A0ABT7M5T1_9PSEU|nr:NAD(P)-dependent oxidoreductase [Actinomycetospora sp. Odt1-22]MDL5156022.1 NAD(P)-dependent oxidoreductase [Actinomycetospora sp. Odt1-22]